MPMLFTSPNFNFPLVVEQLYESLKSEEAHGRANFLRILLESFYDNPLYDRHPGDHILQEYFNGGKNIPKKIINYYAIPTNQKSLEKTVSKKILPKITAPSLVATNLFNLLEADTYFPPFKKAHILENKNSCNNIDSIASLITEMILLSFECKKSKMIKKGFPKSPSLKNELIAPRPSPSKWFTGRVPELKELHDNILKHEKVFVTGVPGIGKSDFILKYLSIHENKFTNIIYWDYSNSLKEDIINLSFRSDTNLLNRDKLFTAHEAMLKRLGSDSIIVVDNFNSPEYQDAYLDTLLQYPCRILISTRCNYPDYKCLELHSFPPKDLTAIMEHFLGDLKDYRKRRVNEIIRIFGRNTFLAVLTAHLIKENMISLNRLYEEVKRNAGFHLPHIFKFSKDRKTSYNTYANHIKLIFSLVKFTSDEREILGNLSLLSNIGIGKNHLKEALSFDTLNEINRLSNMGVLETIPDHFDETGCRIRLPDSLRKIVFAEAEPNVTSCKSLLFYIAKKCFVANKEQEILKFHLLPEMICEIAKNIMNDDNSLYLSFLSHALDYLLSFSVSSHSIYLVTQMENILDNNPNNYQEFRAAFLTYKRCLSTDDLEISEYVHAARESLVDKNEENAITHLVCELDFALDLMRKSSYIMASRCFEEAIVFSFQF